MPESEPVTIAVVKVIVSGYPAASRSRHEVWRIVRAGRDACATPRVAVVCGGHNGAVPELETERLLLRRWRPEDRPPFAALNADPEVMQHFPAPLTRSESDAFVDMIEQAMERDGWGLWAMEERASGRFLGFTGLARPRFEAPFMPAVEIGWRLARPAWGQGFASEAARAAAAFAFDAGGLDELVSMTVVANERSRAVMRRLGMTHDPADDFDHPSIGTEHEHLRRHVLYRLSAARWRAAHRG
jgi:ribosomal-protein-alanine N-acetyltransferase